MICSTSVISPINTLYVFGLNQFLIFCTAEVAGWVAVRKQLVLRLLLYVHSTDGSVCVEATHIYIYI